MKRTSEEAELDDTQVDSNNCNTIFEVNNKIKQILLSLDNNDFINFIKNNNDIKDLHKFNGNLLKLNGILVERVIEIKKNKEQEINEQINLLKNKLKKLENIKITQYNNESCKINSTINPFFSPFSKNDSSEIFIFEKSSSEKIDLKSKNNSSNEDEIIGVFGKNSSEKIDLKLPKPKIDFSFNYTPLNFQNNSSNEDEIINLPKKK